MRSHFELSPAEYEARRQGHLQRRRIALVEADVQAHGRPGDLVVELGCGPGDVLGALARAHPDVEFLGVDVDEGMIEHAATAHAEENATFRVLDLAEGRLDRRARLVFGIDVLHHVHALDRFVRAVAADLEPDGCWTVVEPNSRNPYIWLHQERMRRAGLDEDHFDRTLFVRLAEESGLRVVDRQTAFVFPGFVRSVPRPFPSVERLLERIPVVGGSVVYRLSPA